MSEPLLRGARSVKEQAAGAGGQHSHRAASASVSVFCAMVYTAPSRCSTMALSILLTGCTLSTHKEEAGPY